MAVLSGGAFGYACSVLEFDPLHGVGDLVTSIHVAPFFGNVPLFVETRLSGVALESDSKFGDDIYLSCDESCRPSDGCDVQPCFG